MTKQNPLKYPQPLKIRNNGRITVYRQQVFDIPGYDMRPRAPADIRLLSEDTSKSAGPPHTS